MNTYTVIIKFEYFNRVYHIEAINEDDAKTKAMQKAIESLSITDCSLDY